MGKQEIVEKLDQLIMNVQVFAVGVEADAPGMEALALEIAAQRAELIQKL